MSEENKRANARQRILDTATQLFYKYGFRAVGIDTIIEESQVAKMSLYRYFPSKDDLIVAYLEAANTRFWNWFENALATPTDSPRQQLLTLYEKVETLATSPHCLGCTFQATAAEFPDPDHPGHKVALQHKQAVRERLQELAARAGAKNPAILAGQLLLLMDGAFVATRMYGFNAPTNPARGVSEAAAQLIAAALPLPEN